MEDCPVASTSLEATIELQEKFLEALDSTHKCCLHDFEQRSQELLKQIENKQAEMDKYFRHREQELEQSREAFRVAQRDAIAAAEQLQEVQTELDAHRNQGHQQLKEIKTALQDLLSAVRGATIKHLVLGTAIVTLHVLLFQTSRRREQTK